MERAYESNESGYDAGSQENILSEPHYESVTWQKEKSSDVEEGMKKETGRRGSRQDEIRKVSKQEVQKYGETNGEKVPNSYALYSNGSNQRTEGKPEKENTVGGNKLTIHAVIENVNKKHEEEPEIHNDTSESDDLYEKIDDFRHIKLENTNDDLNEDKDLENHESNKEVVYSHVSIHRTVKKVEQPEEKQNENPMVQQLVNVAEDKGAPVKIPTPPPFRNIENNNTFVEEEYSYEPELKKSSSKLVLRTRSLMNLEEENTKSDRAYVKPLAVRMKITTGSDGTFVIDGRKAASELNLSDGSREGSPKEKRVSISGEDLKRRKEEIFKPRETPQQDSNKYFEEINQNKTKSTKEEAIHNLKKYLKENNIGLKELLTNNNVIIIDTCREKKTEEDLADYNHKAVRDCRITGAMTKGEVHESHTLPRANKVHQPLVQRHYFYSLFKHRPSPPDEELPDPDKVRSTRQMFQKSKEKVSALKIMLPIAAKVGNPIKEAKPTPEVRLINQMSPRRWTDSGSVSSGVSSDMSLLDNMSDKYYKSDDEEEEETSSPIMDSHPVSPEVLKKIRECGTTITYYGGRVIATSHGPGNPMTMTIMDEIRQGREGGSRGKFRLVKSNSCGSRLELAGTDDLLHYQEMSRSRFYDDVYGGTPLSEEMRGSLRTVREEEQTKNEEQNRKGEKNKNCSDKKQISGAKMRTWGVKKQDNSADKKPSWRSLIESRKQTRAMEHNRRPCPDMVFEEFQVLET